MIGSKVLKPIPCMEQIPALEPIPALESVPLWNWLQVILIPFLMAVVSIPVPVPEKTES